MSSPLRRIQTAVSEALSVESWDRPGAAVEAAAAATDTDVPYWMILIISGAIAAFGLATDSAAGVIGAMLIAPLLAPVNGLGLALATGDARLMVQTGTVVLGSTVAVVATGAIVAWMLPFHTLTAEITSRIRPTTLDLGVAVFSGLAAALVTVARRKRLSAAIPGVAISVALIPPLAATGFGIGIGNAEVVRGSLLLYEANLAGIVLSGMSLFLLAGMHRTAVLDALREAHEESSATGLAALVVQIPRIRSLGLIRSHGLRWVLVLAPLAALVVPLRTSLSEVTREARVRKAVDAASDPFNEPGRASILGRELVFGDTATRVRLRIGTTEWFPEEARDRFEQIASARSGETVHLVLEQTPATTGDLERLAEMIPSTAVQRAANVAPAPRAGSPAMLQARLRHAGRTLPLPEGASLLALDLVVTDSGANVARLVYAAGDSLVPQATQMLRADLRGTVGDSTLQLRSGWISTAPRTVAAFAPDTLRVREIATLMSRYPKLRAVLLTADPLDPAVPAVVRRLAAAGVSPLRITTRRSPGDSVRIQLLPTARGAGRRPPHAPPVR
ncbi:hypothetical protein BH20GEM2_BH20GEM2_19700 [soil metagenome]